MFILAVTQIALFDSVRPTKGTVLINVALEVLKGLKRLVLCSREVADELWPLGSHGGGGRWRLFFLR